MTNAAIKLLHEVERSAETPIDENTCREVIAENIRLREACEAALAFYDALPEPHHPGEDVILDRLQAALKQGDKSAALVWPNEFL